MTGQEANALMLKLCGADKFHEKGFTGKGLTVAVLETAGSDHSVGVTRAFKISLPDANYLCLDNTKENYMRCIEEKVDIVNVSQYYTNLEWSKKYVEAGGIIVGATGNNKDNTDFVGWDHIIDFGAIWETLKVANYSTKSEELDMVSFAPYIPNSDGTAMHQPIGTSFSSPFGGGVVGCLVDYWKFIGYKYNAKTAKDYAFKHAVDILEPGRDNASGEGYLRIDFMDIIKAQIGQNTIVVNEEARPIPQGAVLVNGNTMVPFRAIGDAIESVTKDRTVVSIKTDWDSKTKTAMYFVDTL